MPAAWRTVRVFISSTFRDMHAERDWLVKRVFPALRERLEKYRIHLIDIDLRWGITEVEAQNDRVLDLCLQQIDESRPFFVGILGERYGWVPEELSDELASKYGWVQYHTGKSVTELEIVYGVLHDPEMHAHGLFFFRDPAFIEDVPEAKQADLRAEDEASVEKLEALKQAIRDTSLSSPPFEDYPCQYAGLRINWQLASVEIDSEADRETLRKVAEDGIVDPEEYERLDDHLHQFVHRFGVVHLTGLEEFGDRVSEQLWQAIKAEHELPDTPPPVTLAETDPLAEEAAYQEDFMESRLQVYVGRQELHDQLVAYSEGNATHPCLVTGRSGSGKSAAMAHFARSYAEGRPDILLVPHFVGASPGSTSLRRMLRGFCLELQHRFAFEERVIREGQLVETRPVEVPQDTNGVVNTFRDFVQRVPVDARVVLVIDALNQLDETDNAQSMYWLPWELPPQVKVVLSCVDDSQETEDPTEPVLKALAPRPLERLEIQPLTDHERLEIVRRVPSLSAKKLDPKQADLLLSNPATKKPLFLLVALEELRGFGSYEQVADRIMAFPREDDDPVGALFGQVIARLRDEFDRNVVRTVLAVIACSRSGMAERELLEMIEGIGAEQSTSDLFPVLRQLRPYLQHRGELVDFFHRGLDKAVRDWYLAKDEDALPYNRDLAEYFHAKANPPGKDPWSGDYPRAFSELPHHQTKARLWEPLEATLTSLLFVETKCRAGLAYDLLNDYAQAQANLPEGLEEKLKRDERTKRLTRYAEDLVRYAAGSLSSLDIPHSIRPTADREATEPEDFLDVSDRFHGLRAFHRLIDSQAHNLARFSRYPGFAIQQAYNCASSGPVGRAAEEAVTAVTGFVLLLQLPACRVRLDDQADIARTLQHDDTVECVDISTDGSSIASIASFTLRIWDPKTGRCLRTVNERLPFSAVRVTADGRKAVTADTSYSSSESDNLRLWDLETERCLRTLPLPSGEKLNTFDITPNGKTALSGSRNGTLRLWDIETGDCVRALETGSAIMSVGLTADAQKAIAAGAPGLSGAYGSLTVWDLISDRSRSLSTGESIVHSVAITPDGRVAVTADGFLLGVWDTEQGVCLRTLELPHYGGNHKNALSVTPDGRLCVWGGNDTTLHVFDLKAGENLRSLEGHNEWIRSVRINADGTEVISGSSDHTVRTWNLGAPGRVDVGPNLSSVPQRRQETGITCLALNPSGNRAVSGGGGGRLDLWDLETGEHLRAFDGHTGIVRCVCALPDGRRVVSGSADGTLRVWELETGQSLKVLKGHECSVRSVCVTPDGSFAISGDARGGMHVWSLLNYEHAKALAGHVDGILDICLSPDGIRAISASLDGTVRVWNLKTGSCSQVLEGHEDAVRSVCLTPDGQHVISGSSDRTLRIWNLQTGKCSRTLKGHTDWVESVHVTPNGRKAISADANGTLWVWNLESGELQWKSIEHRMTNPGYFYGSSTIRCVAISPCGKKAISCGRDGTVRVWDLEAGECLAFLDIGERVTSVATTTTPQVLVGTILGQVIILEARNLLKHSPVVTPVRIWRFSQVYLSNGLPGTGSWEEHVRGICPWCRRDFLYPHDVLNVICSLTPTNHRPLGSTRELAYSTRLWEDQRLCFRCPLCASPLQSNPFLLDNRESRELPSIKPLTGGKSHGDWWELHKTQLMAGGHLDIRCRYCGSVTFFEPRLGEEAPTSCPSCNER